MRSNNRPTHVTTEIDSSTMWPSLCIHSRSTSMWIISFSYSSANLCVFWISVAKEIWPSWKWKAQLKHLVRQWTKKLFSQEWNPIQYPFWFGGLDALIMVLFMYFACIMLQKCFMLVGFCKPLSSRVNFLSRVLFEMGWQTTRTIPPDVCQIWLDQRRLWYA